MPISERRPPTCPCCAGHGVPLGALGRLHWFRCRDCGMTLDGPPVEIVAGFDRRLGDYFLQVIDERNDMLYTSLQEPMLDWTDVATLRSKVAELGLRLPAQLVDEVEGDGRRRAGNRIVRHVADGPPVTLLAG